MIASIVRFSLRYPGVVVTVTLMLVVYGLFTLDRARVDVFPEFAPTQVVVQTEAPGLSSELVETLVSQRLENTLLGVNGVVTIRSQSIPGLSVVSVLFGEDSEVLRNRQAVAERLSGIGAQMPRGVGPPTIAPMTSSASSVLGVGLTSKAKTLMELRTVADTVIRPHLMSVLGVAEVNVFGGMVRQWQLQVEPERLGRLGVSLAEVLAAARQATGVVSAGLIPGPNQRISIVTEAQAQSPDVLGRAFLRAEGQRTLILGDVGRFVEAAAHPIGASAIDGEAGVSLMVQGQLGSNTLAVSRGLDAALSELRPLLDREKITLHDQLFRPANFIETAVNNIRFDILLGSFFVVAVLLLFLFNVTTAIICATAIPVALLGAVVLLTAFDQPVNIMVLGGLAISLGEVVDDAIIDTENIFRRLRENVAAALPRDPSEVALHASVEVRSSVVYATFIVALVFVPLLTFGGIGGKLFAPMGLAYILAILASLLVATTLTPALCLLLLGRRAVKTGEPPFVRHVKPAYVSALRSIERRAGRAMLVTAVLIALGLSAASLFSGEFVPSLKEGHYVVHMTAVPGTSEREVLRIGNRVSQSLLHVNGVKSVAQLVGRSQNGADTFGQHYCEMEVEIGPLGGEEQARILAEMREILASQSSEFPGVTFSVNTFLTERIGETISGFPADVVVSLFGPDLDALDHDATEVVERISAVRGARDVRVQAPAGTPQLEVRLKHDRLTAYGLTAIEVLDAVRVGFEGAVVGQVFIESHPVDVAVILAPEHRRAPAQVGELPLGSSMGSMVRLRDVADVRMASGRYKILHFGGKRVQTVTANIEGRDIEDFDRDLRRALAGSFRLSAGNYLVIEGEAQASINARQRLIFHSLLAGAGIFILLYFAFNNLRNLFLTFLNLPFALVGGVVAVFLNDGWMTLGSLVGFVTLFGITLRNSIMLVSHYQHLVEHEGLPWNTDTMLKGAAERLPSILMTALVTSLGLMPLALGSGEPGREIEGPMAMIIVGGLVTSTVLNLLILPAVLLRFGKFETKPAASN